MSFFNNWSTGNSSLESSTEVPKNNLQGSIFIPPDNQMEGKLLLIAKSESDLHGSLQLSLISDLTGTIRIRPYNKMEGIVEIERPPSFTTKLYPIKDSFIRSDSPKLNYGSYEDMFVGNMDGWIVYRSLMQFDTDTLPKSMYINKAELVLTGLNISKQTQIQAHEIKEDWLENSVTWANQPGTNGSLFSFSSGNKLGELRINVKALLDAWYKGEKENKGILFKSLNEALSGYKALTTRENKIKPYIEVEYFNPNVYSYGRTTLRGSIDVWATGNKDLRSSLTVFSRNVDSELPGSIEINDPKSLNGSIVINKPNLPSSLIVGRRGELDLHGSLLVKRVVPGEDFDSSIHIRENAYHDFPSSLLPRFSSGDTLESSIDVAVTADLDSSISVRGEIGQDLPSSIAVHHTSDLGGGITVHHIDDLPSSVEVRTVIESSLPGQLMVHYLNDLESSIHVMYRSELESSIFVRAQDSSSLPSEITVHYASDFPSSINVHHANDLSSRLLVKYAGRSELAGQLTVFQHSFLPSSLRVNSPYLKGALKVKVEEVNSLPASLFTRALGAEDLESFLYVKASDQADIPSSLDVKYKGESDLIGTLTPRVDAASDLRTSIDVKWVNNLPSSIQIAQQVTADLLSSIDIRHTNDLPSGLTVFEVEDLPSSLFVINSAHKDIEGRLQPRLQSTSDLSTVIAVHHTADMWSTLEIREETQNDLGSTIDVHNITDLPSSIDIHFTNDLVSTVKVRIDTENDLSSSIDVRLIADIPSSIYVVQSGQSDLVGVIAITSTNSMDGKAQIIALRHHDLPSSIGISGGKKGAYSFIM